MLETLKRLRAALDPTAEGPESAPDSVNRADPSRQNASGLRAPVSENALDLLGLAIAGLEKLELHERNPQLCQVAVLGPTQAGKSTLVNLLVGTEVTTVSALAGHTRHARGAAVQVSSQALDDIASALHPAQRVAGEALTADDLDQFSLQAVESTSLQRGSDAAPNSCIVWDTPDFDSLTANTYRRAVLAIAGMADVIVLIVSRDKYGDMAVWELLERLTQLQRRAFLVINKVDPPTWTELREHVLQTQRERLGAEPFEVLSIQHAPAGQAVDAGEVIRSVGELVPVDPAQVKAGIARLVTQGFAQWTAPLRAEAQARARYEEHLAQGKAQFLDAYRRDYLADAERYDTFQRLLGELLVLLEIPMLARTMGTVRKVVTWPVRQLFTAKEASDEHGREPELLQEGASHLLLNLRLAELEKAASDPFHGRVASRVSALQDTLIAQFHSEAIAHHEQFQATVAESARALYQELQQTPALLNSLRAIRASADAAGVVVALQTGGIGLADLVLTPVMLSLTSTLTESAAKTYVDQIVDELKERQFEAVEQLLDGALVAPLHQLVDDPGVLDFTSVDLAAFSEQTAEFLGTSVESLAPEQTEVQPGDEDLP